MRIYILIILLFPFGIQCSPNESVPKMNLNVHETLQIGTDDPNAPIHETFRKVRYTEVDHNEHLYVVESGEKVIRVYDKQGKFLKNIGKPGSGPGELESISAILIDSQNRLLVVDSAQARLTAYSLEGNLLSTWVLPSITQIHQLAELSNGHFVFVGSYKEHLVHIVKPDFSKIEFSFVDVDDVLTTHAALERILLQFSPGSISILPDNSIIYAPPLYNGKLTAYKTNDYSSWYLAKSFIGFSKHSNPATFTSFEEAKRVDMPITIPEEGRYAIQYHSVSQGVHFLEDRKLVHFSLQENSNDTLELISEYFTIDMEFLGVSLIDETSSLQITVLNMDSRGNIYLSDTQEVPLLRRLTIDNF